MVKEGKDPHRRLVVNKAGAVAPWEMVFVKGNPIDDRGDDEEDFDAQE
jgi:hypothetical protein